MIRNADEKTRNFAHLTFVGPQLEYLPHLKER